MNNDDTNSRDPIQYVENKILKNVQEEFSQKYQHFKWYFSETLNIASYSHIFFFYCETKRLLGFIIKCFQNA